MCSGSGFPDVDEIMREIEAARLAEEILKRREFKKNFVKTTEILRIH